MDESISKILDNRTAREMIKVFERNEGCDFSLAELTKATGVTWITARKALDLLKMHDMVIISRKHGRAVLYKLSWDRSVRFRNERKR